jgi:hypothetical protein
MTVYAAALMLLQLAWSRSAVELSPHSLAPLALRSLWHSAAWPSGGRVARQQNAASALLVPQEPPSQLALVAEI